MKRIINKSYLLYQLMLVSLACLMTWITAYGQSERELQNLTERALNGTAKAQAMGGAMSAVGADASAASLNPAGLGLFTSNQLSGTFSIGAIKSATSWGLNEISKINVNKTIGGVDHISYVINMSPFLRGGANRLNMGISYVKEKDFHRSYEMEGIGMPHSIADYAARTAVNINSNDLFPTDNYDPYSSGLEWFPILAYNAGFIEDLAGKPGLYRNAFVYFDNTASPKVSNLKVTETGSSSAFDASVGYSINDYVYIGATLRSYSIHYRKSSQYYELFDGSQYYSAKQDLYGSPTRDDFLEMRNELQTTGSGFAGVLGILVNLGDYGRIGLSYLSPQLFVLQDKFSATAASYNWRLDRVNNETGNAYISHTTPDASFEYKLVRPSVLTAGAMLRLGNFGMLSYDFDYTNSGKTKMSIEGSDQLAVNNYVSQQYGATYAHRLGIELKPTVRLALRAGAAIYTNPIVDKTILNENPDGLADDLGSSGTMTDIIISKNKNKYYTAGLGYALSKHFSADLAYVYNQRDYRIYPFTSSAYSVDGTDINIPSKGGNAKINKHRFVLTLNYRY